MLRAICQDPCPRLLASILRQLEGWMPHDRGITTKGCRSRRRVAGHGARRISVALTGRKHSGNRLRVAYWKTGQQVKPRRGGDVTVHT